MRTFAQLAKKYDDFYVPTCEVLVGGKDVLRHHHLALTKVQVDLKEKAAGHFSLTVANTFNWEKREFEVEEGGVTLDLFELFAFDQMVEIRMGYGDLSELPESANPLLVGRITEVSSSFSEGGNPELNISGFDLLQKLNNERDPDSWDKKPAHEIISQLINLAGIPSKEISTLQTAERVDKGKETALALLGKLAEAHFATFFMRGDNFHFLTDFRKQEAEIGLEWGKGLLGFSPEGSLIQQVESVEVHSYNAVKGKKIIGKASRNDMNNTNQAGGKSGVDGSAEAGSDTTLTVHLPVHDQIEADRRAKAILDQRGSHFVKGQGSCIGLPDVLPGSSISLGGIGKNFSKTYYITGSTHTCDNSGYKVSFNCEELAL